MSDSILSTNFPLWSCAEIIYILRQAQQLINTPEPYLDHIFAIDIDSRQIKQGGLFVPLTSGTRDGHQFIEPALAQGAALALCQPNFSLPNPANLLYVKDTYAALRALAKAARARFKGKVIAITGSCGKTTTKHWLSQLLPPPKYASERSYNNHLGVPLSLANLPSGAAYGVFEIGMNHAGEITELVKLVHPHISVITAVKDGHCGNFSDLRGIAAAKAEIFSSMAGDSKDAALIPHDSEHYELLYAAAAKDCKINTFGLVQNKKPSVKSYNLTHWHSDGIYTSIETDFTPPYKIKAAGLHNGINSMICLAILDILKLDVKGAQTPEAMLQLTPLSGRGQRILLSGKSGLPKITLLDESYNAQPSSMKAALQVLALQGAINENGKGQRRVAILGDMRELGVKTTALHQEIGEYIRALAIDKVITYGEAGAHIYEQLPKNKQEKHFTDLEELKKEILGLLKEEDVVLIKASFGTKLWQVKDHLCSSYL